MPDMSTFLEKTWPKTEPASMEKMEKVSQSKKGFFKEFVDFLQTFGVIGLAIAFIIVAAASTLVSALASDQINPIIGLVLPRGNLSSLNATITAPVSGRPSVLFYGDFISKIIIFVIIGLVVFRKRKRRPIS